MNRKAWSVVIGLLAVLTLLLLAGCSKKSETSNEKEESEARPRLPSLIPERSTEHST